MVAMALTATHNTPEMMNAAAPIHPFVAAPSTPNTTTLPPISSTIACNSLM